jgi:putative ubiquitin-RnfH superfamily antitoxin RatB of RatAB toxin-antitoxin module
MPQLKDEQEAKLVVEVVLALPDRAHRVRLRLPVGATVGEAIKRSGLSGLPEAPPLLCGYVGRWGKACSVDDALVDGDRVELYRPLIVDPMVARRRRAQRKGRG